MKQVLIASPISENFTTFLIEKNYELIHYDKNDLLSINNELIAGIITSNKLILSKTEIEKYRCEKLARDLDKIYECKNKKQDKKETICNEK